jgi:hypothetical protein
MKEAKVNLPKAENFNRPPQTLCLTLLSKPLVQSFNQTTKTSLIEGLIRYKPSA